MPILAVVGISETSEWEVLAFSVGDRENEQAWNDLQEDLKQRLVKAIDLWIRDGNQAMLNAIKKQFPSSDRQRYTRWTTCSATYPTSSRSRSNQN
jgi:putative transposase